MTRPHATHRPTGLHPGPRRPRTAHGTSPAGRPTRPTTARQHGAPPPTERPPSMGAPPGRAAARPGRALPNGHPPNPGMAARRATPGRDAPAQHQHATGAGGAAAPTGRPRHPGRRAALSSRARAGRGAVGAPARRARPARAPHGAPPSPVPGAAARPSRANRRHIPPRRVDTYRRAGARLGRERGAARCPARGRGAIFSRVRAGDPVGERLSTGGRGIITVGIWPLAVTLRKLEP
ncbi:putative serine-threonine protein kinase [Streptomyces violaceusniger Tu 4113]|uniref:Serine-threonine protein kinase n=1 Tax=Streptomyces violaceusniger (strain Tu 4113) TaxID=653045 RepID=G2NT68_STRV4|nr:putative serine-threonine protein kinase [Streptomyces violaceusniger Tu 4113]